MSLKMISRDADVARSLQALLITITAAKGLQEVMKSNLGPRGTLKLLVSGSGDLKLTKDGNVLLHEMQIQLPTASLIARAATAQDDNTGDGTTSIVLLIGEILKQSEKYLAEGLHPRILLEGFEIARSIILQKLETLRVKKGEIDAETLLSVARTSLRSKIRHDLADHLSVIVRDALLTIRRPNVPLDLFMVEIMHMQHRTDSETRLVKGIVLDHGGRHPDMPKRLQNCFILTCNVNFEYEKSDQSASVVISNAVERHEMAIGERKVVDDRIRKVIELKKQVCTKPDQGFLIITQKGIDPMSLDMFAKEGILALRRAKRRNMERLTLACGGIAVNSVEDLSPEVLGKAGQISEYILGEDKYTFVEGVENPFSVTILIKGPNQHTITQIKDAIRDGLRAVKNALDDNSVIPGGGAFEVSASEELKKKATEVKGRGKFGVLAMAEALLVIPKTLAANSGFDPQESLISLQEEVQAGHTVGLDVFTGDPMDPVDTGVFDNYSVKRQIIQSSVLISSQLLLVDEMISAGRAQKGQGPPQ